MHTPDGFLTSWICVVGYMVMTGLIIHSLKSIRFTKQKIYNMTGLAVIIFAFQMLNFSIGNGTSGHFIGGALVALLMGPEAAVLVLTAVLGVQALVFGDGGFLALGVNSFLLGAVAGYTAHYVYKAVEGRWYARFAASMASVVAAAFVLSVLLGMSGMPYIAVVPAMVLTHLLIGAGEGVITTVAVSGVRSVKSITAASGIAVLISMLALPFASSSPDGLESVAIRLGFFDRAVELLSAPVAGYSVMGSGLLALFAGCAVLMAMGLASKKLVS